VLLCPIELSPAYCALLRRASACTLTTDNYSKDLKDLTKGTQQHGSGALPRIARSSSRIFGETLTLS
jgi:hypothetical protein